MTAKLAEVPKMSGAAPSRASMHTVSDRDGSVVEIITSAELAARLRLPESWVRSRVQNRTPSARRIPHLRAGRYVRFRWNSPELNTWLRSLQNQ
jgi:hypothetical protein